LPPDAFIPCSGHRAAVLVFHPDRWRSLGAAGSRVDILSAMTDAGEIIKSGAGEKISDLVSVFRLGFGALVITQMRIFPSELLM